MSRDGSLVWGAGPCRGAEEILPESLLISVKRLVHEPVIPRSNKDTYFSNRIEVAISTLQLVTGELDVIKDQH